MNQRRLPTRFHRLANLELPGSTRVDRCSSLNGKNMVAEKIRFKRPFGIFAVIILEVGIALFGLVFYALMFYMGRSDLIIAPVFNVYRSLYDFQDWLDVIRLLSTLFLFIMAYGLWQYKRWAWVATMAYVGIGMIGQLWAHFFGKPDYLYMLIYVLIVFYLNQSDVQSIFSEAPKNEGETWTET
jgi:hypothetical protein